MNSCVDIKHKWDEFSKLHQVTSFAVCFDGIYIQTRQDRHVARIAPSTSSMAPVVPTLPSAIATHLHKLVSSRVGLLSWGAVSDTDADARSNTRPVMLIMTTTMMMMMTTTVVVCTVRENVQMSFILFSFLFLTITMWCMNILKCLQRRFCRASAHRRAILI